VAEKNPASESAFKYGDPSRGTHPTPSRSATPSAPVPSKSDSRATGSPITTAPQQTMLMPPAPALAKTTKPATGGTPKSPPTPVLTHEQIAARAKAIWQAKGCKPGQDTQNWFEAEAQLKAELGMAYGD